MGKVNIKGEAPVGPAALCRTCSNAHILSGYRESEVMVVCTATYPDFPVPFVVRECSGYNDRNRPRLGSDGEARHRYRASQLRKKGRLQHAP